MKKLIILISLLILISLSYFAFTSEPEIDYSNVRLPIGMESYQYDYSDGIMTDTSGMQFKTEINGVITINDERYLAFALKGTIGGTEYTYTSMDFGWTWHIEQDGNDYTFWAENDNANFIWKQYYYFYADPWKPMKIKHYIENNLADITDMQMYYLTNVLPSDTIEYDETKYLVSSYMGLHREGDFNDLISNINFNAEYDFRFEDLVNEGFTINEFYIGSGSIIGKPAVDITAIGFTKNNGNFPEGTSVWIDPEFTTETADSIALTPLTDNTFIVAWCDETGNDIEFKQYYANETQIGSQVTVDSSVSYCWTNTVGVSTFNSTHFVIGWFDSAGSGSSNFAVYNSSGNLTAGPVTADANADVNGQSTSVSTFNSTYLVIGWHDDTDEDASFRIYDSSGNAITGIIDADEDAGNGRSTSVSTFNSTYFVIGWLDGISQDATFSVYDSDGTLISGPIDADTAAGDSRSTSVSTFNSTNFVIGWFDSVGNDITFRTYMYNGTAVTGKINAAEGVGNTNSVSVSALNSSYFAISWYDQLADDASFRIYDSDGNAITGIIDSSTTADNTQAVASQLSAVDIGFCDNNFIHAFVIDDSTANWTAYNSTGGLWDGSCPSDIVFEDPTPGDRTTSSSQVNINVSCLTGDVTLWFDANVDPTNKTIDAQPSPSNFSTQITVDDTYYYKAFCTGGVNSSVRQWSYDTTAPYLTLNSGNFFNRFNTSSINYAESLIAKLDITFQDAINSSQFKINITNSSGNTIYNLTNLTLSGTSHRFTNTINVNSIVLGTYEVNITITDSAGNINQTNYAYTLTGAGVDNCSVGGYPTISFYMVNESRSNESAIEEGTRSMDFWFEFYSTSSAGVRAYDNFSTIVEVSNETFCINPNGTSVVSNITIDYVYEGIHFTYQPYQLTLSNSTKSVNLYVVEGTTATTFNVKDTFDNNIEDAYITIEKFDVGTNTFKATEILRTDTEGNAIARIVLITTWYRFRIQYGGTTYLIDGPVKLLTSSRNFRIDLIGPDWYDDFAVYQGIAHNLSFNNGTKLFVFHWNDPQLTISQACLKVTQTNISGNTILSDSCTSSHSGSKQYDIGTNASVVDKTYLGQSYVTIDGENYILDVFEISFDTTFNIWAASPNFGIFMTLLLCITLAFAGLWNPGVSMMLLLLGIGVMRILNVYYMSWTMYSTLAVLAILIIWRSQRK